MSMPIKPLQTLYPACIS